MGMIQKELFLRVESLWGGVELNRRVDAEWMMCSGFCLDCPVNQWCTLDPVKGGGVTLESYRLTGRHR